nr:UDP-N-acetyl-D-mannosamine dehydrogenase [uncultured Sphingomonas sp.]
MMKKTICVIGLGYIGLPTAALLAAKGYEVAGVDINPHVVETINEGRIHIVEPDLDAYVRSAVASGNLKAFAAPQSADVYMICVPTPFHESDDVPQPNIDYILSATGKVAPLLKAGDILILESTSPVGTTHKMAKVLKDAGVNVASLSIAYCPERVLPGKVMIELVENDRIVGGYTPEATRTVSDFYRTFVDGHVLETDAKTAEMCKLTENSFRDVNIAFANELSLLCDREGINVWNLIKLANHHPRVNILQPGAGVGGHCIAVDPWFIVARNPGEAVLIKAARGVNNHKTEWVIEKITSAAAAAKARLGRPPRIACMGLAFKPDIDDLRESPALEISEKLVEAGYDVVAVEPNITEHPRFALASLEDAGESCDVFAFLVKHKGFLDPAVKDKLSGKVVLDFCGIGG